MFWVKKVHKILIDSCDYLYDLIEHYNGINEREIDQVKSIVWICKSYQSKTNKLENKVSILSDIITNNNENILEMRHDIKALQDSVAWLKKFSQLLIEALNLDIEITPSKEMEIKIVVDKKLNKKSNGKRKSVTKRRVNKATK